MEYFINVVMSVLPQVVSLTVLFIVVRVLTSKAFNYIMEDFPQPDKLMHQKKVFLRTLGFVYLVSLCVVLYAGAASSANTWKNVTFNEIRETATVERLNESKYNEPVVIQDLSKPTAANIGPYKSVKEMTNYEK